MIFPSDEAESAHQDEEGRVSQMPVQLMELPSISQQGLEQLQGQDANITACRKGFREAVTEDRTSRIKERSSLQWSMKAKWKII